MTAIVDFVERERFDLLVVGYMGHSALYNRFDRGHDQGLPSTLQRAGGEVMMPDRRTKKVLSEEDRRVLKEHWEWGGEYAIVWLIVTILLFGSTQLIFEFLGAEDRVWYPGFILLSTLIIVNTIWRAAGALAARIDLANRKSRNEARDN